jgi:hypothetical protein
MRIPIVGRAAAAYAVRSHKVSGRAYPGKEITSAFLSAENVVLNGVD